MKTIGISTTKLIGTEPREGELLITKIQRAKKQGELIKDVAEIIYTPRSAGVIIGHDITADKWLIRAAAKNTIDVDKLEKRQELIKPKTEDTTPTDAA